MTLDWNFAGLLYLYKWYLDSAENPEDLRRRRHVVSLECRLLSYMPDTTGFMEIKREIASLSQ